LAKPSTRSPGRRRARQFPAGRAALRGGFPRGVKGSENVDMNMTVTVDGLLLVSGQKYYVSVNAADHFLMACRLVPRRAGAPLSAMAARLSTADAIWSSSIVTASADEPASRSEEGVRSAQKMQVEPRIPVGIQLRKAAVGPTSGPTWYRSRSGQRGQIPDLRAAGGRVAWPPAARGPLARMILAHMSRTFSPAPLSEKGVRLAQ
jgi:hypothetical protein